MLQFGADEGDTREVVVRQVQHQEVGEVEAILMQPFVSNLVVVEPEESQVGEALEILAGDVLNEVPV